MIRQDRFTNTAESRQKGQGKTETLLVLFWTNCSSETAEQL